MEKFEAKRFHLQNVLTTVHGKVLVNNFHLGPLSRVCMYVHVCGHAHGSKSEINVGYLP